MSGWCHDITWYCSCWSVTRVLLSWGIASLVAAAQHLRSLLWLSWKLTSSLWNLREVLALLNWPELLHFKPNFQEWTFGGFLPLYLHIQRHGPHYSQHSGNCQSEGWTIVRHYEVMTAPSYIHAYKKEQSRKSTRKEFNIHDLKGAYTHVYATLHFQAHSEHYQLQCNPTATSVNQCKQ